MRKLASVTACLVSAGLWMVACGDDDSSSSSENAPGASGGSSSGGAPGKASGGRPSNTTGGSTSDTGGQSTGGRSPSNGGNAGAAGEPESPGGTSGAGAPSAEGGSGGALGGGDAGEPGVTPEAGAGGEGGAAAAGFTPPALLSETGLYASGTTDLAPGVHEYAPKYELWSDGATKRRWVYLPPGTQIDTSNMDYWVYPVGTKLWKEFALDGDRIETRLIQKYLDQNNRPKWFMMAFLWRDDLSDADAVPDGVVGAKDKVHDVPEQMKCGECHSNVRDSVLGFSAVQILNAEVAPSMAWLADFLSDPPTAPFEVPGSAEQSEALGYLHANCGHCHNDMSQHATLGMRLWLEVAHLGSVAETDTYTSTVGQTTGSPDKPANDVGQLMVAGEPEQSAIYQRMSFPVGDKSHMPHIGTRVADADGIERVMAFIGSL